MNQQNKLINDYLYFGYLPPSKLPDWLVNYENYEGSSFDYSSESASKLLIKIFDESLSSQHNNGRCIIPISGGWDSRILLGLALKRFENHELITYTFGTKGQLDFEIGNKIAKKYKTRHYQIDLNNIQLSWDDLYEFARCTPWTYLPDAYFNFRCYQNLANSNDSIISGFMGEALTGAHFIEDDDQDVATKKFLLSQNKVRDIRIIDPSYLPEKSLPELPVKGAVSYPELLDFGVRQAQCIVPIISRKLEWQGWNANLGRIPVVGAKLITPFTHPEWVNYWIKAPKELKKNQSLYLQILKDLLPDLYEIPSKNFYGANNPYGVKYFLKKKNINLQILLNSHFPQLFNKPGHLSNYINYQRVFTERKDYKELLMYSKEFINSNRLTPWLNIENMIKEHEEFYTDHTWAFLKLIGLAVYYKAKEIDNDL